MNAQSLLSNLDELKLLIYERSVDVLCISETWLLPHTPDYIINIPEYKIHRFDKGRGGGVCIYAKQCLNPTIIDTKLPPHPLVENIFLKVQCRKLPSVIVGCMYRHPKAHIDSFEYISELFKSVCMLRKTVFILGDLNDNLLLPLNKLSQITRNNKLTQLITSPTRITSTSATLIDVIITNKPELALNADVIPSAIADHDLVTTTVNIRKPKRSPMYKTVRDLRNYSTENFCSLISRQSHILDNILKTDNVNKQADTLTKVFTDNLTACAPMVSKEIRRPPAPWLDDSVRQAMRMRNDAQNILKRDPLNETLRNQYKSLKKQVKSLTNNKKKQHYRSRLQNSKGNITATWKVLLDILPSKKNSAAADSLDNTGLKADELNSFFANVGKSTYEDTQTVLTNEAHDTSIPIPSATHTTPFRPEPVDVPTVVLTIKHLQETQSFGSDGISLKFIKDSLCIIAYYLTIIINTSIVTGTFPKPWKHAIVIPLHKGGDPLDKSNYRPISLLPIFSKVLEKIVSTQLVRHLESNKLLSKNQHGFRPKLSTTTALTVVTDQIFKNMDNKRISLLTLCDLSKAFDSVSHPILIEKIKLAAVDAFWFEDYLKDRSQSVRLNNTVSTQTSTLYGVPQGSILGPILFNLFVNDMAHYITNCSLTQYADDTQFLHSGTLSELPNIISEAEQTLNRARKYFLRNGLKLNAKKTQCIFIGTHQLIPRIPDNTTLSFCDTTIKPSSHVKNLGVHFDNYMLFDTHINEISNKITGTLFYINRVKHYFDKETRTILIQSLVLTVLDYCNTIWGTTNTTLLSKTQKLQNFAIKVADGNARKFDHVTPIFRKMEWLNVMKTIQFNTAVTLYKQLNCHYPLNIIDLPTVNTLTGSVTRQQNDLYVPRAVTQSGSRSLSVRGPSLWNLLPKEVKESHTLHSFRTRLRKFLLLE